MYSNCDYSWDGSHIGDFFLSHSWTLDSSKYYSLTNSSQITIACRASFRNNSLPVIIEGIAKIFTIPSQGVHRARVFAGGSFSEWTLYYVPLIAQELVWEVPLNYLPAGHYLRSNAGFSHSMRRLLIFADCLALANNNEGTICIRNSNGISIPVLTSESTTTVARSDGYDFSTLRRTTINKWFGEEMPSSAEIRELLQIKGDDTIASLAEIQSKIEEVIRSYDRNYLWYSTYIIERLSRFLF